MPGEDEFLSPIPASPTINIDGWECKKGYSGIYLWIDCCSYWMLLRDLGLQRLAVSAGASCRQFAGPSSRA